MTTKLRRVTAAEAAKTLGISKTRVLELINLGILPADKICNRYILKLRDVIAAKGRKVGRPRKKPLPVVVATVQPTTQPTPQPQPPQNLAEELRKRMQQQIAARTQNYPQVPRRSVFGFDD